MPDNVKDLTQLQDLFYTVTSTILSGVTVRHSWAENGQPVPVIDEEIAYIYAELVDDPYDKQRDITYIQQDANNAEEQIFYTEVLQVSWTLYGRSSFDNARKLKNGILTRDTRSTLMASRVFPLPGVPQIVRMPYPFAGQNWDRSDLQMKFNVENLRTATVPYLESAEIKIYDDHGLEKTIDVTP